jgi:hypothetical protein
MGRMCSFAMCYRGFSDLGIDSNRYKIYFVCLNSRTDCILISWYPHSYSYDCVFDFTVRFVVSE